MTADQWILVWVSFCVTGVAIKWLRMWTVVTAMREKISPEVLNGLCKATVGKDGQREVPK